MWPASLMRAASVSPDVSLDSSRVSETVRTAMRTGTNATDSSIGCCGIAYDHILRRRRILCSIAAVLRPFAESRLVQRGRLFASPPCVHPIIRQNALDVVARLHRRHALDEEKRILHHGAARTHPARQRARA